MESLAENLKPPYYAAILNEKRDDFDATDDPAPADRMVTLATRQPGFLGLETGQDGTGARMTVSYWRDIDSIEDWKAVGDVAIADGLGIRLADACDIWITHISDEGRARGHLEYMGFEPREPAVRGIRAMMLAAAGSLVGLVP